MRVVEPPAEIKAILEQGNVPESGLSPSDSEIIAKAHRGSLHKRTENFLARYQRHVYAPYEAQLKRLQNEKLDMSVRRPEVLRPGKLAVPPPWRVIAGADQLARPLDACNPVGRPDMHPEPFMPPAGKAPPEFAAVVNTPLEGNTMEFEFAAAAGHDLPESPLTRHFGGQPCGDNGSAVSALGGWHGTMPLETSAQEPVVVSTATLKLESPYPLS